MNGDDICSICHEILGRKGIIITDCDHKFHKKCLEQWEHKLHKKTCPNCRSLLNFEESETDLEEYESELEERKLSQEEERKLSQEEKLRQIIEARESHEELVKLQYREIEQDQVLQSLVLYDYSRKKPIKKYLKHKNVDINHNKAFLFRRHVSNGNYNLVVNFLECGADPHNDSNEPLLITISEQDVTIITVLLIYSNKDKLLDIYESYNDKVLNDKDLTIKLLLHAKIFCS